MFHFLTCDYVTKNKFDIENGKLYNNSLFFITKGEIQYTIDKVKQTAYEGDLVCFPSGIYFERIITKPLDFYHLRFSNPEKNFLPLGKMPITDEPRLHSTLRYLCNLESIPQKNEYLKNHFLNDIFAQLEVFNLISPMKNDEIVAKACDYLNKNLGKKISLDEIAKTSGISVPGLIAHFKATLGISPIQYLISARIKHSETLLCYTSLSIAQVAAECGFDNQYYFSTTFKKHNKISPNNFRKKYIV